MQESSSSSVEGQQTSAEAARIPSFGRLLERSGIDEVLAQHGYASPTAAEEKVVSELKGSREGVVINSSISTATSVVPLFALVQQTYPKIPGITVIVANTNRIATLEREFAAHSVSAMNATRIDEAVETLECTAVVGNASDIVRFFSLDISRAIHIGQLILWEPEEATLAELKEVLGAAAKRARRPSILLFAASEDPWLAELAPGFFQLPSSSIKHLFVEVSGELTAKPSALADFIESEGMPSTLIFCNQASDTEFVEVMLKKRGLPCERLAGLGHSFRGSSYDSSGRDSGGRAPRRRGGILIATDASARSIDPTDFQFVVNYSIPSDPEVYLHRTDVSAGAGQLRRVLSLVGPLDKANFHYLKKIVESEFLKAELPSPADLVDSKFSAFVNEAKGANLPPDELINALAERIEQSADKQLLMNFLLNAFINKPTSRPPSRAGSRGEERASSDDRGREDRRHGRSRSSREDDGDFGEEGRGNRRRGRGRHEGGQEEINELFSDERGQPARREPRETLDITRIFVGAGSADKIDVEALAEALKAASQQADVIRRVICRPKYSFVDVISSATEETIRLIEGLKIFSKSPSVRKAISLSYAIQSQEATTSEEEDTGTEDEESYDSDEYEAPILENETDVEEDDDE